MSRQHRLGVLESGGGNEDRHVCALSLPDMCNLEQAEVGSAGMPASQCSPLPYVQVDTADVGKGLRGVMSRVKTGGHFGWNPCSGCKTFPMVTHRASCTAQGMPSRHPKLALCCVQSYCLHCLTIACFEARAQLIRLRQMLMHI